MSLKVFDLQCSSGHVFEGWFGSANDYDNQRERGILTCPVCNSREINKMLSAPRLNMGKGQPAVTASQAQAPQPVLGDQRHSPHLAEIQAQVLKHMREMVRNSENVGDRFASEARRMHEGEIEPRSIRGSTTEHEREELARDGIAVMPIPDFLDDDRMQ
ncbi:MAG TPA: DUF1178 family protein [Pusillimonas sp.]|uniref:DUF1178 family protein n=1 Tax=Pusillimonas sp. TaxID=3040095 RepID=UPI002BAF75F6|nr:DUF1178 family protein [Pusillimonas sp.]HUH88146.1 DUF1178 family protein [Pusillimonas sp.]